MLKKSIIPVFIVLLSIVSCAGKPQSITTAEISPLVNRFLAMHAKYHKFDDTISERMLKNYINSFDYGKYYFYQSDIDSFMKESKKLDDYTAQGNYHFMFQVYEVYKKRLQERMGYVRSSMKDRYNFSLDEHIIADRSQVPYAKNKKEMDARWHKNNKLQLLNYLSSGKNIKEAKAKLLKKYRRLQKNMEELTNEDLIARYLNAFSMALDPHSNYLTRDQHEDFKISMELKLEGIGARLRMDDGFVIIESLIPGGAADKMADNNKPKPNDKIVAVAQGAGEPVDVIDMDLRNVVKKIRGPKGTEVRLTIIRENAETGKSGRIIIPIIREEVKLQDSDAESKYIPYKVNGRTVKVGYIKLPSFYQDFNRGKSSSSDMKFHLKKLKKQGAQIIVLDLRGNPGGLLREAVDIAGLFIDQGPVVQIKGGTSEPIVMKDTDPVTYYKGPLVVLIDKFSASASEILAGAIGDYNRGLIIGPSNTFGKGTVQSYNVLPHRLGAVKITTHIFYQPGGTSNQMYGIAPHVIVPDLSALWDIGEAKTKYPLKWQPIPSADYEKYKFLNNSIIRKLRARTLKRVNSNPKYIKLLEKIKKFRKTLNSKTISLKEESKLTEEKKKEIRNKQNDSSKREIINLEKDLFLREALNVSGDYLKLLGR